MDDNTQEPGTAVSLDLTKFSTRTVQLYQYFLAKSRTPIVVFCTAVYDRCGNGAAAVSRYR
eukprot:SAG31_NODE_1287_length_8999_cov_3.844382_3_plen_61_part_00